jgi:hypothetical protein
MDNRPILEITMTSIIRIFIKLDSHDHRTISPEKIKFNDTNKSDTYIYFVELRNIKRVDTLRVYRNNIGKLACRTSCQNIRALFYGLLRP